MEIQQKAHIRGVQEQDQEWIFSIGTGAGADPGVIFNHSFFKICIDYLHSTQSIIFL